jgi:cobalamin synthase
MGAFLRGVKRRQEHIAYFVICFMLFALAIALAKPVGWWAVGALWVALVAMLELVYRWTVGLGYRNRRKWWARPHRPGYWWRWRLIIYVPVAVVALLVRSPFLRYGLLALLVAGLLAAGIIRWMERRRQV